VILEIIKKEPLNVSLNSSFWIFSLTTVVIALWSFCLVGYRPDHLVFYFILAISYFFSRGTRQYVLGMIFFTIFWIMYDSLRVFPNYMFNEVSIGELYNLEKSIFGINHDGTLLTANEYFRHTHTPFLDILTGIFYLTWVPVPLGLATYFFFTDKVKMLEFTACYLLCNLIGFVGYYSYPAAPPWYMDAFGDSFMLNVKSSAAELVNFDSLIGSPVFQNIYTKNSNIFAAMPSLHSAYPVVAFYYATKQPKSWLKWLLFVDIIGIWFSAVYSFHHYVLDVVAGATVAVLSILLFEKVLLKTILSKYIRNFALFIDKQ
jgi:inositol phosphorylceramide synthase catalytic subunit